MDNNFEWLEADGLGGFAFGNACGIPSRKYHSLLATAAQNSGERLVLVNCVEAILWMGGQSFPLSSFKFENGHVNPGGVNYLQSFTCQPFPTWTYKISDTCSVICELFMPHEQSRVVMTWRIEGLQQDARLLVRPLISGRNYHELQRANQQLSFVHDSNGESVSWHTYSGMPRIVAQSNGAYIHEPVWYYNFLYEIERDRGYDCIEDLAAPGIFEFQLCEQTATISFSAHHLNEDWSPATASISVASGELRARELERRRAIGSTLEQAADAYLIKHAGRKSIVAGYPWFSDWGRDTFIALRGLCLALGRYDEAREILLSWGATIKDGLVPNRFPDRGETPDYNSVDASLWYIVAAWDYLELSGDGGRPESTTFIALSQAVSNILQAFCRGTLWNIRCDSDGLLACGQSGVQLTWMDAKVGDWVVTPRTGKPVEIQALWLNALKIGSLLLNNPEYDKLLDLAARSFQTRFPCDGEYLCDVVDVNHQSGIVDLNFRINQIFAVGGLPFQTLHGELAHRLVDQVEKRLFTPNGMRTLAPNERRYMGHYQGGTLERDSAYHQGTAWFWLLGAFVDAWVRVRNSTPEAKAEARQRFVAPLLERISQTGCGHLFEIADGDAPHTPRGAPCQAWSLGELLRLDRQVLAEDRQQVAPRLLLPCEDGISIH